MDIAYEINYVAPQVTLLYALCDVQIT